MKSELANLSLGSYFYFRKDSLYYLFQLLAYSQNHILVQGFWSTTNIPSMENINHLDIKSACSEFDEEFDEIICIGKHEITDHQEKEMTNYQKIKAGKIAREAGFIALKREAIDAFEKQEYQEAIRLFSLAAPYSKYDIEIYEKRGIAYLKSEKYIDALADFDYYLIHNSQNELVHEGVQEAKRGLLRKSDS